MVDMCMCGKIVVGGLGVHMSSLKIFFYFAFTLLFIYLDHQLSVFTKSAVFYSSILMSCKLDFFFRLYFFPPVSLWLPQRFPDILMHCYVKRLLVLIPVVMF